MQHTELQWEPLSSSHVAAMAVNEGTLYIQYTNGTIYEVEASDEEVQGLRNAASPGRYLRLMFQGRLSRLS